MEKLLEKLATLQAELQALEDELAAAKKSKGSNIDA
jgi:hypothetical protein